jgi:hypothetical protein
MTDTPSAPYTWHMTCQHHLLLTRDPAWPPFLRQHALLSRCLYSLLNPLHLCITMPPSLHAFVALSFPRFSLDIYEACCCLGLTLADQSSLPLLLSYSCTDQWGHDVWNGTGRSSYSHGNRQWQVNGHVAPLFSRGQQNVRCLAPACCNWNKGCKFSLRGQFARIRSRRDVSILFLKHTVSQVFQPKACRLKGRP